MSETDDQALVFLVRHGKAEDHHSAGDEARGLTAEGRQEFRELAAELGPRLRLAGIATSPLVRATQTAEILAHHARVEQVEVHANLAAREASAEGIAALARRLGPGWALVGHNPSMSEALAHLLGLGGEPRFRKGAVAALRPGAGPRELWTLAWVISPGKKRATSL
jgi:phosphohistidine phosphatase